MILMLTEIERSLLDPLAPTAEKLVIYLVAVDVVGSKKAPTILVYIDCEGGIGFEELSCAQSWINDIMDELDPFPGAYMLEVSSPGMDRPLIKREHYERYTGSEVEIKLYKGKDGTKNIQGVLDSIDGDSVTVTDHSGKVWELQLSEIAKANLAVIF